LDSSGSGFGICKCPSLALSLVLLSISCLSVWNVKHPTKPWKHPTKPLGWNENIKHSHKYVTSKVALLNVLKTSNKATLDEIYIQNDILRINNLFKMSAGKFMHSYENNQLPSHFNQYFKSFQTVHKCPTRLPCSKNFLPRVNSSQGQCSLKFFGPKVGSEIPDHIKFQSHFDFKHLYKNYLHSELVGANQHLFKLILYCPFFVICIIFSFCLARYFILRA